MKNIVLIGMGVILIGMTAGVASLYFSKSGEPPVAAAEAEQPSETFYFPIKPEFIVNFGQQSDLQFLMLDVTVSSLDSKVPAILDTHLPEIRNDLLMLFSSHANEKLYTEQGKKELREGAIVNVKNVLQKHYPGGEINDLFFTRFVMQ